ncbi:MAG: beta-hexosaminidase [Oscillospiraceae bacterium]|nr:beta-hexosaminidase [Oscillospiraceae bacterium]
MKRLLILLALLLAGCSAGDHMPTTPIATETQPVITEPTVPETTAPTEAPTEAPTDPIEEMVNTMTVEEKVGQLFLARYDAANAQHHVQQYHLSGWILFSADFEHHTPDTIHAEIDALQVASAVPLLMAVDEEGGTVTRVSRYSAFRDTKFPSPRKIYDRDGLLGLMETEAEKCRLLTSLGLNVNVGPVCDITTDKNAFMYARSLGQTPEITGQLIAGMVDTMAQNQVGSVLKHFPGYGNNADTHVGIARDNRSLEALEAADLVPFRYGIDAGCDAILVSHTIVEALDDTLPASLSPAVISYLRSEMGFDGVILTDDLVMQAITDTYGAGEAAVLAVLAGNDLLCASEYVSQYEAVLAAVQDGRIPMERIDEAVYRVLRWKQKLGLLTFEG